MHHSSVMKPSTAPLAASWNAKDVERWLVVGFMEMMFRPVYAPQGNTLLSVNTPIAPMAPSATFDMVAFAVTVLGKRSDECRAVLTWARSTAARRSSKGDWSVAEFCRDHNWDRRTFDRRRTRACEKIALAKNIADGLIPDEKK